LKKKRVVWVIILIIMQNVGKTYANGTVALHDINVEIGAGEFVYVVGPSGAGKSTFIKLMYREEKASLGEIFINGFHVHQLQEENIPFLRRGIGVVFQDFKLLPRLTVFENVAFALEVIETDPEEIQARVMEVLELVGLAHKARNLPGQLSGGEQQRVAVARALVNRPQLVIADEPTGNLDPETSDGIMNLFAEINQKGTTVVMATHNKEIVNNMKRRVIAFEGGHIVRDEEKGEYGYAY
jgi:cell division transport system ATP-binding protein